MAGKAMALSVVINLIDKATAPLKAIGKAIKPIQAAGKAASVTGDLIDRFRAKTNAVKIRWDSLLMTKGVREAANRVRSSLKSVWTSFKFATRAVLKLTAALTAYGGTVWKIIKSSAEYGDEMRKTAQKVGIAGEAWQELAYAGKLSGISTENFATGLTRFNKNVVEAAAGSKTMAVWFKRAGVAVRDARGKLRSTDDILMDLSDRMAKMPDGAKKTALAVGLFGRSGAELIPFFNTGRKGIKELREEARRLGVVLSDEDTKACEEFNDNVERLFTGLKGFANFMSAQLIPVLNDIVVKAREWMIANADLIKVKITEWVERVKNALPGLIDNTIYVVESLAKFCEGVSTTVDYIGGWGNAIKGLGIIIGVIFVGALAKAGAAILSFGLMLLTTPVGWFIAGMTAIITAGVLLYKNWDKIKQFCADIWEGMKRTFGELVEFTTLLLVGWMPLLVKLGAKILLSLWNGMKSIWGRLVSGFNAWKEMAKGIWESFSLYDIGVKIFSSLWDGLKAKWKDVKAWFSSLKRLIPDILMPGGVPAPLPVPAPVEAPPGKNSTPVRTQPIGTPAPKRSAMATRSAARAYAGSRGAAQVQEIRNNAAVEVKFANLPKGTTVHTVKNDGVDLQLNQGYAFATS